MLISHGTSQEGPPPADSASSSGWNFTGTVRSYLVLPPSDGILINSVCFEPGARTFWHTHEQGQILQVVAGGGLVQVDGEPARALSVGDTVWSPPGERHWHGARPDSYMVHVAISIGGADWQEEVAASDYEVAGR